MPTTRKHFAPLSVAEVQALQQLRGLLAIVDKALVPVAETRPHVAQLRATAQERSAQGKRALPPTPRAISRHRGAGRATRAFQYHLKDRRRAVALQGQGRQDVYRVLQKTAKALTVREVAELANHPVETTQQILAYLVKQRIAVRFHPTVSESKAA